MPNHIQARCKRSLFETAWGLYAWIPFSLRIDAKKAAPGPKILPDGLS